MSRFHCGSYSVMTMLLIIFHSIAWIMLFQNKNNKCCYAFFFPMSSPSFRGRRATNNRHQSYSKTKLLRLYNNDNNPFSSFTTTSLPNNDTTTTQYKSISSIQENNSKNGGFDVSSPRGNNNHNNINNDNHHQHKMMTMTSVDDNDDASENTFKVPVSSDEKKLDLKLILIDNYDSYTYNLFSYLANICKEPPLVVANDEFSSWSQLLDQLALLPNNNNNNNNSSNNNSNYNKKGKIQQKMMVDGIVISPGPGSPTNPSDMGICIEVIEQCQDIPILGVCLGHQALGHVYGAEVRQTEHGGPVHGLMSNVWYQKTEQINNNKHYIPLWDGIPQNFPVTRYHSLEVVFPDVSTTTTTTSNTKTTSSSLDIEPIAWCSPLSSITDVKDTDEENKVENDKNTDDETKNDNICMALQHKKYPHIGVQFHPESIATGEYGYKILENFCKYCASYQKENKNKNHEDNIQETTMEKESIPDTFTTNTDKKQNTLSEQDIKHPNNLKKAPKYSVFVHKVKSPRPIQNDDERNKINKFPTPEDLFEELNYHNQPNTFWLDSSNRQRSIDSDNKETDVSTTSTNSRFSIFGSGNDGTDISKMNNYDKGNRRLLNKKIEYFGREHQSEKQGVFVSYLSSSSTEHPDKPQRQENVDNLLDFFEKEMEENGILDFTTLIDFDYKKYNNVNYDDNHDENIKLRQTKIKEFPSNSSYAGDENSSSPYKKENSLPSSSTKSNTNHIPFEFRGGYVGYFGYEFRHDTRDYLTCKQHDKKEIAKEKSDFYEKTNPMVPTAAFLFADRSLVYDHWNDDWYIVAVTLNKQNSDNIEAFTTKNNYNKFDEETGLDNSTLKWMQHITDVILSFDAKKSENDINILKSVEIDSKKQTTLVSRNGKDTTKVRFLPNRSKEQYLKDIHQCHEIIRSGESYELCLTNQLQTIVSFPNSSSSGEIQKQKSSETPYGLYKILRKRNPAPYAAFINMGIGESGNVAARNNHYSNSSSFSICCSSPERFLSVTKYDKEQPIDDHFLNLNKSQRSNDQEPAYIVESKPIKGTSARDIIDKINDLAIAEDLRTCVKNRAENLMIVDLLRNDLSRVCDKGSVIVPKLMHIESFATVHQLVSTIRGLFRLNGNFFEDHYLKNTDKATPTMKDNVAYQKKTNDSKKNIIDIIAACFPGGSMTGAPKLRTVDILDDIEMNVSRGPYSGSLGFLSLNGSMDMNIIIRSAIVTPTNDRNINVGTGSVSHNCLTGSEDRSWKVSIGAGGAITYLSESDDEFEEMMLKSRALRESVQQWQTQTFL